MVQGISRQVAALLQLMHEHGITKDVLPPAVGVLPACDQGPKLPLGTVSLCAGWDFDAIDVTNAAAIINISISTNLVNLDQCATQPYMLPYGVLLELDSVLPAVLGTMEREGAIANLVDGGSVEARNRRSMH